MFTLHILLRYGSERLKKEYLAPSITGEYVGCVGSSEPGAGSDVANIKVMTQNLVYQMLNIFHLKTRPGLFVKATI